MPKATFQARGILCEATYQSSSLDVVNGRDNKNPGRRKDYYMMRHKFTWPTPFGESEMSVNEFLECAQAPQNLAEIAVPFDRGVTYRLDLASLTTDRGHRDGACSGATKLDENGNTIGRIERPRSVFTPAGTPPATVG